MNNKPINRRQFLRTGAGLAISVITVGARKTFALNANENNSTRWALLADTHIQSVDDHNHPPEGHYFYNPQANLKKVLSEVLAASPQGAIIAGDLARLTGEPGDYAALKKILSPAVEKIPVCMALGNHDHRRHYYQAFPDCPGQKQSVRNKHVIILEAPPVRLILLDSLFIVDEAAGLLGRAQRRWLEQYLKNSDNTPTILIVHHTLNDSDSSLLDVPRLYNIIEPLLKVKAIIYGHSHRYGYSEHEGIHLINLPAVGYSFRANQPVGWVEAEITTGGGDFTLHVIDGNKEKDGQVKMLKWRT